MIIGDKFKAKGFLVWGICTLFFLYDFSIRTVMGTYQLSIMEDLNLTVFQFSLISTSLFALMYGAMQIPVGIITGSFGLKRTLVVASLICTVSSIGFSFSNNYLLAVIYRMLMGLGSSFGFICVLVAITDWMPYRYNAIFIGLSQLIGTLGPMFSSGPLGSLSSAMDFGWRFVFLIFGFVGFILMFLIALFVENKRRRSERYVVLDFPKKRFNSIGVIFSRVQPWYIALFSACVYFSIEYLSENEVQSFLSLKGMSFSLASYMITISWIGYAIGSPIFGFLSDIFRRRKIFMVFSSFFGLISVILILYSPFKSVLPFAFFLLGVAASGQIIGFATIGEQFAKENVAIGFGFNNIMITVFIVFGSALISFLLSKNGSVLIALSDYVAVFNILIALFVVAFAISLFFIKETYCKSACE